MVVIVCRRHCRTPRVFTLLSSAEKALIRPSVQEVDGVRPQAENSDFLKFDIFFY